MKSHLRRALPAAAAAVLAAAASLHAQRQELQNLKTPTSPAFVILGIEPTSVERPSTPRAFALSLLSAAQGEGGVLPENYAAEFAPYWMRAQPRLTFQEYFRPTMLQSLRQTFSVSLATNSVANGADSVTGVGVGVRFSPRAGEPSDTLLKLVRAIRTADSVLVRLDQAVSSAERRNDTIALDTLRPLALVREAEARALSAAFRANDERVGLRLDFAGALAAFYPQNDFRAGQIGKTAFWGTLAYRLEQPGVDVIALGRWLRNDANEEQNVWDVGGRAVLLYDRFSGSVEWVARSASDASGPGPGGQPALDSGNRVVGMLEYKATGDLFFSFSFGQDYPIEGDDRQPLVAILGGQLNFGSKPSVALPPRQP
jgi:hypothetical protein